MTALGKAKRKDQSPTMVKRVLIVDDHPMIRQAIAEEVHKNPAMAVCGEASDSMTAIELAEQTRPDIAFIDLRLEAGQGLELITQLCQMLPDIACLVYSMLDESLYAEQAIEAGALGYLSKRADSDEIAEALRTVSKKQVYLSKPISDRLLRQTSSKRNHGGRSRIDMLSEREMAVFEAIGKGQSVQEIAEQMAISPKTVDAHRQHIKHKLQVDNNTELLYLAAMTCSPR